MAFGDHASASLYNTDTGSLTSLNMVRSPSAGNLLILAHHVSDGAAINLPTDNGTGVWSRTGPDMREGSAGRYNVFYKIAAGDETTITCNSAAGGQHIGILQEIEGPWPDDPFDKRIHDSDLDGLSFDTGILSPPNDSNAYIYCAPGGEPSTMAVNLGTILGSFTEDHDPVESDLDFTHMGAYHRVLTSRIETRMQGTWSATHNDWNYIMCSFVSARPGIQRASRRGGIGLA